MIVSSTYVWRCFHILPMFCQQVSDCLPSRMRCWYPNNVTVESKVVFGNVFHRFPAYRPAPFFSMKLAETEDCS